MKLAIVVALLAGCWGHDPQIVYVDRFDHHRARAAADLRGHPGIPVGDEGVRFGLSRSGRRVDRACVVLSERSDAQPAVPRERGRVHALRLLLVYCDGIDGAEVCTARQSCVRYLMRPDYPAMFRTGPVWRACEMHKPIDGSDDDDPTTEPRIS